MHKIQQLIDEFFVYFYIHLFILNKQFVNILEKKWLALGRNVKFTCDVRMSPKRSKFQKFDNYF